MIYEFFTFHFSHFTYAVGVSLIIGWLLDLCFGDPERLPHPIVWFGKWIGMGERRLNHGNHRMLKGALFTVFTLIALFVINYVIFNILLASDDSSLSTINFSLSALHLSLTAIAVFFCLAGHTLRKEVRMVFEAVDRSLDDGRKQVARIVGRDTSSLDAQEIRTAALETLAENLSDGVIAPLFWFAILGVPGMLTYKMINTFDSMIGYQNERYKDFGCWAAHIDDIANYIPARLTALLMIAVAPFFMPASDGKNVFSRFFSLFSFVCKYGPEHASPNSGWPEAALAGMLNCRFGGPHNYFGEYFYKPYIGTNPRQLTTTDMKKSIRLCFLAECFCIAIIAVISFVVII